MPCQHIYIYTKYRVYEYTVICRHNDRTVLTTTQPDCTNVTYGSAKYRKGLHLRHVKSSKGPQEVYRHFGPRTLRTQDTSDLPKFGPRTLRHDRNVRTLRHWCRSVLRTLRHQCRSVLALDNLSTYREDQSHCILCKGLPVDSSYLKLSQAACCT